MSEKLNIINDIHIKSFRGINNLMLSHCERINLILGDNNVGKTSILESIYLSQCDNIADVIWASSMRCGFKNEIMSDNFKFLFNFNKQKLEIDSFSNGVKHIFELSYDVEKVIFDSAIFLSDEKKKSNYYINQFLAKNAEGKLIDQYSGYLKNNGYVESFSFNEFDLKLGSIRFLRAKKRNLNIIYNSPYDHFNIRATDVSGMLEISEYHELLIQLLKIFDESIDDVLLLQKDDTSSVGSFSKDVYLQRKGSNPEPLYLFGDGIKKVLDLAIVLIKSKNGILLIDEIETSLHHKYFNDVFTFLVRAAESLNIQLFITTHNDETIRHFLNLNIGSEYIKNFLRVFTIRKRGGVFYTRSLSGISACNDILNSSVELRN